MKQGINVHMPVKFCGIDMEDVLEIVFLFKQRNNQCAEALKTSVYKSDGTGDAQLHPTLENVILVPWERSETYKFAQDEFYMDTRITIDRSTDNPATPIVRLIMNETLFEENDDG